MFSVVHLVNYYYHLFLKRLDSLYKNWASLIKKAEQHEGFF